MSFDPFALPFSLALLKLFCEVFSGIRRFPLVIIPDLICNRSPLTSEWMTTFDVLREHFLVLFCGPASPFRDFAPLEAQNNSWTRFFLRPDSRSIPLPAEVPRLGFRSSEDSACYFIGREKRRPHPMRLKLSLSPPEHCFFVACIRLPLLPLPSPIRSPVPFFPWYNKWFFS